MGKLGKYNRREIKRDNTTTNEGRVVNFMGGMNYVVNPFKTMQIVTASSIMGEASYYRASKRVTISRLNSNRVTNYLADVVEDSTTEQVMEQVIDDALSYDFRETLFWAESLRTDMNMRLNPQVIMVRAAIHKDREQFTRENPGLFDAINQRVMSRGDDVLNQISYYIWSQGGKRGIPSILKRSWANNLNKMTRYSMAKYANHELGMINACRIAHASKGYVPELMKTGKIELRLTEVTWETLRRDGKSWTYIWNHVPMGHMAMLRNLKNFLIEVGVDSSLAGDYLRKLVSGVENGKQFPFRYYRAYIEVTTEHKIDSDIKQMAKDALEKCMTKAVHNMPKIHGKTVCLSDNSGSAWGCFTSEFGNTVIAEIDNLSSVITAMCSDDGYVVTFGDTYKTYYINKNRGVLEQAFEINNKLGNDVGKYTEGGIWGFLDRVIKNSEKIDNLFIYSDQQAGTGGLYGTERQYDEYEQQGYSCGAGRYIDVYKIIEDYRKYVNQKVNVYSVQTAGYPNAVIPEYQYRTTLLSGWTGKEAEFAAKLNELWDSIDEVNKY